MLSVFFLTLDALMRLFCFSVSFYDMCCINITKRVTQMKMQCIRLISSLLFRQILFKGDQINKESFTPRIQLEETLTLNISLL